MYKFRTALVIPTRNADGSKWTALLESIKKQSVQPDILLVIDSESSNDTLNTAIKYGACYQIVKFKDFNHGATRQMAVNLLSNHDIIIFMTQDTVLADDVSLEKLINAFSDPTVSAAYGRQLTGSSSSLLEKVSRKFNYPLESRVKTVADIPELGISTAFCSDSFAAYRVKDLLKVGGFPRTDFGEDMLLAAKLLESGGAVAYIADARIFHSHSYSIKNEFNRGKAIGRMHADNGWLLTRFGSGQARGAKLMKSAKWYQIPLLVLESLPKYLGYKLALKKFL